MARVLVKDATSIQAINLLANGAMDFAQRIGATTVAIATDNTSKHYYIDRWHTYASTDTASPTIQRLAQSPTGNNLSKYCLQWTGTNTSGACPYNAVQRVEAAIAKQVAGGTASLSFWWYSDTHQFVFWSIAGAGAEDNFSTTSGSVFGQISLIPGKWQYVTIENIAVPSTCVNGLQLDLDFFGPNVFSTSATHRLTQVMLTPGPKAATYSHFGGSRSDDLAYCLRFYTKSFELDTVPANGANATSFVTNSGAICVANCGNTSQGINISQSIRFKVDMRAAPTFTKFGNNAGAWYMTQGTSGSDQFGSAVFNPKTGETTGVNADQEVTPGTYFASGHYTADAEM